MRFFWTASLIFLAQLGAGCSRMGPPPGGPEDKQPPEVAGIFPSPDTTGVPLDVEVSLTFSEKVRQAKAESLVSLSPDAGRLYFKWEGRTVRVRPSAALRPEVTYRVQVAPGLEDLHRVASQRTFTSYFSTGAHFSPGRVEGTVTWKDTLLAQAVIYAVPVQDSSLVFRGLSDSTGSYAFPYLPLGEYRMNVFRDRNRNGRFDFTREESADTLVHLIFDPLKINFELVLADTTAPFLGSVQAPDSLTVALVFDDLLDPVRTKVEAAFELRTPDSLGRIVKVDSAAVDSSLATRIVLYLSEPMIIGQKYFVKARGVVNSAGLAVGAEGGSRVFTFEKPRQKSSPGDRGRK